MQEKKNKINMPVKIDFQVVASTGEDERFRATELNYHGPTARGWRSSVSSTFPLEIILQLKVLAILQQIQILAHQYLIPQKIEICTSSRLDHETLCNNSQDLFEYLGFITFSDNKATGFRSRELKSILIPSKKVKYIKLRIHKNHVNEKNIYNQVGLMAVNILGNELQSKIEEVEMNNNVNFQTNDAYNSITYNSNYLSPYDDLAFQMSVDEETAKLIKIIEYKMLQAVFEERLDYANALKITIENLRAAGEILGIYEQEKRKAINLEDFDRAKSKKIQIDNFRQRIYSTLRIDKLLDEIDFEEEYDLNSNLEEKTILSNEGTPVRNSQRRNRTTGRAPTSNETTNENVQSFDYEDEYQRSPSRLLRPPKQPQTFPNQLIHSQSQTFPDSSRFFPTPTFSTSVSNPHLYQYLKQSHSIIPESKCEPGYKLDSSLEHVKTPSSISDSLSGDELGPPKSSETFPIQPETVHKWNGSLIPRRDNRNRLEAPEKGACIIVQKNTKHRKSSPPEDWDIQNRIKASLSEQKIRSKAMTTNTVKSSFEAYEDRMLPALKSYHGNEIVRECQLALDQQRKSTLNEREKKQAMLPIAVFGIEMIEKFYSKSFNDKEEGLKQLQQELKKIIYPTDESIGTNILSFNKIARGVIFLLHRSLRDTVYSVYKLAAETVRFFFSEFVPQRVSPSEVAKSVEKLLPELLTKSGDVTPRIHNLAAHTLLSMAECEEVRRLNIIPVHLSRPLTSSVHPRLALSRLEMVEQLILNHGISKDKKSGLTCRTLAEFGSSGLHHPAEAVRKVSERILIHVYKVNPRIVRKQLPPDDNVTRRNLLYRQLFQEFDFMDVQRKLSEQTLNDSITVFEKNPQLLPTNHLETQNKFNANQNLCNEYFTDQEIKNKPIIKLSSDESQNRTKTFLHQNNGKEKAYADKLPSKQVTIISDRLQNSEVHLKRKQNELSPSKKEEKCVKSSRNGVGTLKFPSLTDSVRTTKARMPLDQKKRIKANGPENGIQNNQTEHSSFTSSSTKKESRGDVHIMSTSGIPVPTFGILKKLPTSSSKKPEKEQKQHPPMKLSKPSEGLPKPKTLTKTIKIKMFGSLEDMKLETIENAQKSIKYRLEKNGRSRQEMEMGESIKFSDSILASIRENEFTMSNLFNGRDDAEEKLKKCIFCLSSKEWTNEDSLNTHYLKDCLMLTTCEYCLEVTEVSGFTNHLLDDCKWRHIFQKCVNCQEAILKDLYDKHECTASAGKAHKTRCPFCHKIIENKETSWRKHLTGNNTCPNHPRQK